MSRAHLPYLGPLRPQMAPAGSGTRRTATRVGVAPADLAAAMFILACALILLRQVVVQPYPLGHDVYFHIDAAEAILNEGLRLPETLPHYWGTLPFGYPPLFHTLVAALSWITGVEIITLVRAVPVLLLPLALALLYALCRRRAAGSPLLHLSIFVLLFVNLLWPLYAGEYPRLLAFVWLLIAFIPLVGARNRPVWQTWIWAGSFCGLTLLTNFAAAFFAVPLLLLESTRALRSERRLTPLLGPATALAVSSLWWLRVSWRYGATYLPAVLRTHQAGPATLPLVLLAAVGVAFYIWRTRRLPSFFTGWLLLGIIFFRAPFCGVPLAIFGGDILTRLLAGRRRAWLPIGCAAALALLLYALILNTSLLLTSHGYMNDDVAAAAGWIRSNTPADTSIMTLGTVAMTRSATLNGRLNGVTEKLLPLGNSRGESQEHSLVPGRQG